MHNNELLINKESLKNWMKRYSYLKYVSLLNENDNYQYDKNGNAVVVYDSAVGTPDEKHLINRNGKDMIARKENGKTIYPKIICPVILSKPITYAEAINGKRTREYIDMYLVSFDKKYFHYALYDNHCNEIIRDCQVHQHGFEISYIEKNSDHDKYYPTIEPETNECVILKGVFGENGIIIAKTEDERYFVLTQDTNSIIIFPDDIYQFDEFRRNPTIYGFFNVRVGNKCNILDMCGILSDNKYFQFVFKEWVDDILRIGPHLIIKKGNTYYIADGEFSVDDKYITPFDEIYRGANRNIIIKYKDKWNALSYHNENGKLVPELLDDKWFDGMYDFGTDDIDGDDNDFSPCPIVERNGKYTYICLGDYTFLDTFCYVFDRWFDDCEPCYKDEADGKWKFPVTENGKKYVLDWFGHKTN